MKYQTCIRDVCRVTACSMMEWRYNFHDEGNVILAMTNDSLPMRLLACLFIDSNTSSWYLAEKIPKMRTLLYVRSNFCLVRY